MTQLKMQIFVRALVFCVCSIGVCAASAAAQDVEVLVSQTSDAAGTRYHYRVVNHAALPITTLRVGFDYAGTEAQLNTLPTGWTFEQGLPAVSVGAVQGWRPRVVTIEESERFHLEWSSDDGPAADIAPGATATGFWIRVSAPAPEYESVFFDVILSNSSHRSSAIKRDTETPPPPKDTTAPKISVALTPNVIWPPNGKLVDVSATLTVSDETDPRPTVKLVSITCDQTIDPAVDIAGASFGQDDRKFSVRAKRDEQRQEGRTYVITYSASDAAGNTSTATGSVRVPHDQGR